MPDLSFVAALSGMPNTSAVKTVVTVFAIPRSWAILIATALGYWVMYLLVGRGILVDTGAHFARFGELPIVQVAPNLSWGYLTDRFNPPFVAYLTDAVALAPTVPVLASGIVLGALVGANLAVAVATVVARSRPSECGASRPWWAISALPSFLASFSCCAPTVLLFVGANFAVATVAVIPYVVPLSLVLLGASFAWSVRRLARSAGVVPSVSLARA